MTNRSSRDAKYVLVQSRKPKATASYYADDDYHSQIEAPTRRIVRTKPREERRVKYVTSDELDADYRRERWPASNDRDIRDRRRTNSERVILDDDDHVIKLIRDSRSPTSSLVEHRRVQVRPRESRPDYYESSYDHPHPHSPKPILRRRRTNDDFVYAEEEPTRILRRVIVDPHTGDRDTIYENDRPRRQPRNYDTRQRTTELLTDSEEEYDERQRPHYVRSEERRPVPARLVRERKPTTKYVMVRKKPDADPEYAAARNSNRRVVYLTPKKTSSSQYVYSTDRQHDK